MSYLLVGDLDSIIYSENRDEIVRSDNSIIYQAIESAIGEAKSYMARFDLLKIFGNDDTDPVVTDEHLKAKVKDLVLWQLVKLGNPNIKVDMARTCYEDAIKWFEKIAISKVVPGWPMPADDADTDVNENDSIQWDSEDKRQNHY